MCMYCTHTGQHVSRTLFIAHSMCTAQYIMGHMHHWYHADIKYSLLIIVFSAWSVCERNLCPTSFQCQLSWAMCILPMLIFCILYCTKCRPNPMTVVTEYHKTSFRSQSHLINLKSSSRVPGWSDIFGGGVNLSALNYFIKEICQYWIDDMKDE